MSQGVKLILIIIVGLAAIGGIIFFVLPRSAPAPTPAPTNTAPTTPASIPTVEVPSAPTPSLTTTATLDEKAVVSEKLRQASIAFAERYGSFSNQGNFENITDLYSVMSASFESSQKQYVADQMKKKSDSAAYFGVTTKALSVEIVSLDLQSSATVLVKTQREEETSNSSVIKYQDLVLMFKLENGQWKVDSATWK
jgi:hypothetical protein